MPDDDTLEPQETTGLGPPPGNLSVPLFVYGNLKSGELGFRWIEQYVQTHDPDTVAGSLYVRDGLPLLVEGAEVVHGELTQWCPGAEEEAYRRVGEFEPRSQYRWKQIATGSRPTAWALIGRSPDKGSHPWDVGVEWSARLDPAFNEAMGVIADVIARDGASFQNFLDDASSWSRFFRIQAAYLLLWSVLERYTALAFGPGLDPMARVKRLAVQQEFLDAVRRIKRRDNVLDVRDPDDKYVLSHERPERAALYYYQIRNNVSHRGKSAWRDGNRLRDSLAELHLIVESIVPRRSKRP